MNKEQKKKALKVLFPKESLDEETLELLKKALFPNGEPKPKVTKKEIEQFKKDYGLNF